MRIGTAASLAALGLVLGAGAARADWERGVVPEGANAYTVARREFRLDLLGRTAFGLGEHVEVATYLPLDLLLFPNLELKVQVHDGERLGWALSGGIGAGAYPYAGGGGLPFPPVAVGVAGIAFASFQHLGTQISWRAAYPLTLTVRGNAVTAEVATLAAGVVVSPQAAAPVPLGASGATVGATGGVEADVVLGEHDVLVLSGDIAHFRHAHDSFALATFGWTHAWRRTHLTLGAYSIFDVPDFKMAKQHVPLGPYANLYWTFR